MPETVSHFEGLTYQPELFVGREQEIGQVAQLIEGIGTSGNNRVLKFAAEKGAGASWFAHHLVETVIPGIEEAVPFLISFQSGQTDCAANEFRVSSGGEPESKVKTIMTWLAGKVGSFIPPNPVLFEITWGIRRKIEASPEQKYVFVFDAMNEGNWDLVGKLNNIFGDFMYALNTGIVIVSKGGEVVADNSYLTGGERSVLPTLTLAETEEQLARQRWKHRMSAEEIFRLGGGYPLNSDLLAQKDTPAEALAFTWEQLTADQSKAVKNGILAVALSGGVDDEMIGQLLGGLDPTTAKALITQINAAHMWKWQDSQYQVHESVAVIADNYLRYHDRGKWAEIHRRSQALFLSLASNPVPGAAGWAEYFNKRANEQGQALKKYDLLFCSPMETEASIEIGQGKGKVRVINRSDSGVVSLQVLSGLKGAPPTLTFDPEEYWLDTQFAVV